jgi:hypothetical protein
MFLIEPNYALDESIAALFASAGIKVRDGVIVDPTEHEQMIAVARYGSHPATRGWRSRFIRARVREPRTCRCSYIRTAELCTRLSRELRKIEVLDPTFDVLSRRKLMAVNMLMRLATKLRLRNFAADPSDPMGSRLAGIDRGHTPMPRLHR